LTDGIIRACGAAMMARGIRRALLVGSIAMAGAAACSAPTGTTGTAPRPRTEVGPQLQPLASCGDVEGALRSAAVAEMDRRIDASIASWEQNYAKYGAKKPYYCDGHDYGSTGSGYYGPTGASATGSTGSGMSSAPPSGGTANDLDSSSSENKGPSQSSTTNNQVVGVDEADFIKNQQGDMFVVSDGALRIIDAWPAMGAHVVSQTPIAGTPKKLFVSGDRVLVYVSVPKANNGTGAGYYGGTKECTYGYDCDFNGDGTATRVMVYDVADRAQPKLVREINLSGSFINARRVGDAVYTVVHDAGVSFPKLAYYPKINNDPCNPPSPADVRDAYEELRAKNREIIFTTPLTGWLPWVSDVRHENGTSTASANLLGSCSNFFNSPLGDGSGFLSIVSLSLEGKGGLDTASIVSRPGAVYASADSLYLSVRQSTAYSSSWYQGMSAQKHVSSVHKFALSQSPPSAKYAASGVIKGSVLNQFALDEHQGHLRVATSYGKVPDPNVHSTVTVLAQKGSLLEPVGIVDNIAPKEDIRSARFAGDRGFIVTFKKTDPLYVFDLADPRKPAILGELKIPGFSTYMHMMGEKHLLTIGYDADDKGSFAYFTGVLLQIFDVSDPTQPKLAHKEVIGTRGSSSEALTNHLAFTYFAPKNLLALPMTICEGGTGNGLYGTKLTFSGLMVYDVTSASGFKLRGKVAHPLATTGGAAPSCQNWWTNASSQVKRSIVMDDYVFSVSQKLIKANHLDNLATDVATVSIAK
jgi:uncharacterized secreted protein with C-terminal beta-propeller domain